MLFDADAAADAADAKCRRRREDNDDDRSKPGGRAAPEPSGLDRFSIISAAWCLRADSTSERDDMKRREEEG